MTSPHDDFELKRALDALPRVVEPPEDLWPGVRARLTPRRAAAWWRRPASLRVAAGLVVVALAAGWLARDRRASAAWRIAGLQAGAPPRAFTPGDSLRTAAGQRALMEVGRIGRVELGPETRVRLLASGTTRQRLALDAGSIAVRVNAPPRVFAVETPSGTVVDQGCAYTLEVDSARRAFLHVTIGWVSFEQGRHESLVPAGFRVRAAASRGVGTPLSEDAPAVLAALVGRFDVGEAGVLDSILAQSRRKDAVTLWHLLARTEGAARQQVYQRLASLVPPPPSVNRGEVLRLDRLALRLWWLELPGTIPIYPDWAQTLWTWWLKFFG
jgi:hypothetical protein